VPSEATSPSCQARPQVQADRPRSSSSVEIPASIEVKLLVDILLVRSCRSVLVSAPWNVAVCAAPIFEIFEAPFC
jgi:hypothetical protein